MTRSGKSRAADSASAMPSITGIWMSVSRRSKAPPSRVNISSASAPSCAVTVTCPSMAIARATSARIEASSSAIRTRGISIRSNRSLQRRWGFTSPTQVRLGRLAQILMRSRGKPWLCGRGETSYTAAGDIALVEEADIDAPALGRRRGKARLEPGAIAGFQRGLVKHGVPGVDLGALRVADGEAEPRQRDGLLGLADDHALDHQHRLAFHGLG